MSLYHKFGRPRDVAARTLAADTSTAAEGIFRKDLRCHETSDYIPFRHMLSDRCIFPCNVYSQ